MHSFLKKFFHCFAVSALLVPGLFTLAASETLAIDSIDMSGVPLQFIYASTDSVTGLSNPNGRTNGDVVVYRNVGTSSGGVSIDAVVTTQISGATIGNYDNTGSASNNNPIAGTTASHNFQVDMTTSANNGTTTFVFDFYEARTYTGTGTGTTVSLRNVKVTAIDIDGSGAGNQDFQYVDLTGFQKYTTANPTSVNVSSPSTGVVRFKATDDSNGSNRPADRVQVTYDTMGRFTAVFGNELSGALGYFGLLFVYNPWNGCSCTTVETNNSFNSPPTSTSSSRYVTSGAATQITLDDFGTYADVDANPFDSVKIVTLPTPGSLEFFNGASWTAVTLNQVISVSDIELGKLRFTGSATDSIGFKVFDGLLLSVASYTISLNVAASPQTITFANPGSKASGQTFSSGASASSGLTTVLVSLTPGICTVSGLSITTVANGTCSIKATQPGDSSWTTAVPVIQTFTVSSLSPQTITFANLGTKTWAGSSIAIVSGATASSGLAVTLVSFTPSVCTVSGLTITAIAQGSCRIKATQPGNGSYSAASPVEQIFLITSGGGGGQSPTATTQAASSVTATTATLNGSINANGSATTVTFCWGTHAGLVSCSSVSATPNTASGSSATSVSYALTSLVPSTTYYFRVTGSNGLGTVDGSTLTFNTSAASNNSTTSTTSTTIASSSVCVAPTLSTGTIPNGYVGEPFSWSPVISAGTFTFTVSSGSLPNGLSLGSSTGSISGTPLTAQTSTFEITATPVSCSGSANAGRISVTIVILPPGRVSGIVWIDINKNGKRETKEPLLPGITVTLSPGVSSSAVRSHALTATSAADGSYLIKGVDAGNYVVTAKLSSSVGLTKFWDSKGSADWKVPVTVVSLGEAKANFAAVGNTTMTGTVVSSTSVSPKNAKVSCTWAGIDGKLGTNDDVVYTATADSSGGYSIPSTPIGEFSCVATDVATGKMSTESVAKIASGSRGTVSVAALQFGVLPETGSSSQFQVWLAFMLLLAGVVVTGTSRRRRSQH